MPQHRNFPDLIEIGAPFSNVVVDGDYAFLSGLVAADIIGFFMENVAP